MSSDPKNLVGTTLLGRYQIDRRIAEGGMGAVFQATQLSLGRQIAIKVVKSSDAEPDAVRRFEQETEVIARLAHPHIVQVVDAGRAEDGTLFLAMELLDGDNLRAVLRKVGPLPVPRVLAIVEDIASALSAAHAGGVIHRDLKAENVMLVKAAGKPESAKVLDFGVAKLTKKTEAPPQTGSGFVAGTPGCIAPEQMLGKSDDPRSDLYSVGVLMFEMLVGTAPFVSESSVELMMRHLTEPAPRASAVAAARGHGEIPQAVDDLVASLLAKDPDGRPASAEALVDIIVSLRDASRATQADLRLMTPQGGLAVPTPAAASGTPQVAVPSPTVTAATTVMPKPTAQPWVRPSLKKLAPRIAGTLVIGALLSLGGLRFNPWRADRPSIINNKEVQAAFDAVIDGGQFMNLDLEAARRNLDTVVRLDPNVPLAHLLLAQIAILEGEPLTRIDGHLHDARMAAAQRAKSTVLRTRTESLVDALSEIDPREASIKWQRHLDDGPWWNNDIEAHMFAQKMSFMNHHDGAEVERLFLLVDSEWEDLMPASRLGIARARRLQAQREKDPVKRAAKFDDATQILEDLLARSPHNAVIVGALVDVDLARAQPDKAVERLTTLLQADNRSTRLARRLASLKSATDPRAFERTLTLMRSWLDGNSQKADGLSFVGYQYASRGRFAEANGLWDEAVSAAADDRTRVAEIAVFAATFATLGGDVSLARKWMAVYSDKLLDSAAHERLQPFHIANRVILAAQSSDMAERVVKEGSAVLRSAKTEQSAVRDVVMWHALTIQGQHTEALATAAAVQPCFRPVLVGRSYIALGEPMQALAAFQSAATPEAQTACTSGDSVIDYLQSLVFATTLGHRAKLALELGDRADAQLAVDRFRAFWPYASSPPGPASSTVALIASVASSLAAEAPRPTSDP
jgi:serine/threonine-protein kinase